MTPSTSITPMLSPKLALPLIDCTAKYPSKLITATKATKSPPPRKTQNHAERRFSSVIAASVALAFPDRYRGCVLRRNFVGLPLDKMPNDLDRKRAIRTTDKQPPESKLEKGNICQIMPQMIISILLSLSN